MNRRRFAPPRALAWALAIGLPGCADVCEAEARVAAAPVCCSDGFGEIRFAALPIGQRKAVELTSASTVMALDAERGEAAGLEPPDGARRLEVQLPTNGFVALASDVDPRLALLDADQHVIEVRRDLPLPEATRVTVPPLVEWHFGARAVLPPGVRYVVLLSRPGPGHPVYASATTRPQPIPPSPVGTIALVAL